MIDSIIFLTKHPEFPLINSFPPFLGRRRVPRLGTRNLHLPGDPTGRHHQHRRHRRGVHPAALVNHLAVVRSKRTS